MQKKILKLLALLFVCLCGTGFLSSCGDDGDDEDEPKGDDLVERLQGNWYFETMKISVMGQTIKMTADQLKGESGYDRFYDERLEFSGEKVNGLSYSVDKNMILLPWYTEQGWWGQVSFSGSRMTIYYSITEQGIPMQLWTTYVRSGSRGQTAAPADENAVPMLPSILRACSK